MKQTTVRFPVQQIEEMDDFVEESDEYDNRSQAIRAAMRKMVSRHRGDGDAV